MKDRNHCVIVFSQKTAIFSSVLLKGYHAIGQNVLFFLVM